MRFRRFYFRAIGFLLLLALALSVPILATAQNPSQANTHTTVVFYADSQVEGPIWPALFGALRRELSSEDHQDLLPENAHPPEGVNLMRVSSLAPGQEFAQVIEVHLLGRCDVVQQAYRPLARGPLGWVLRVSGEIQPFVYVDCERLAQVLNPKTLGMNNAQRTAAMATAIARITVHEWLHIELQSGAHTSHGIRRAELSASDLVTPASNSGGD